MFYLKNMIVFDLIKLLKKELVKCFKMCNLAPKFIVVLYQAFQILMDLSEMFYNCINYASVKAENKNKMLLL